MYRLLEFKHNNQAGVTLLLSILLLASISAVAFSLAAVSFVEVRTSGDVQRTEPIFYSDQGIAEEAVFGQKRQASPAGTQTAPTALYFGTDCATNYVPYIGPSTVVTSEVKICSRAPGLVRVRIPASSKDYPSAKRFYLFDPSNSGLGPGGYDGLKITNASSGSASVRVFICRIDQECKSPAAGTSDWIVDGSTGFNDIAPGSGAKDYSSVIDTNFSYEVSIINLSTSGGASPQDLYIDIETRNGAGALYGLPYLNKKAIDIHSTRTGLSRQVEVLVPTQ